MTTPIEKLARVAGSYEAGHRALLNQVRRVAAPLGVEVVDVWSSGRPGTLDVRVRLAPICAATGEAGLAAAREPEPARRAWPPEPPFVSPVRASAPFEGDGTTDVLRFIREADAVVGIPPRTAAAGTFPMALQPEERIRMVAGTIAGDVLLSLEHQGRHLDARSVDAALRQGRAHYAAEVARAGFDAIGPELMERYDTAAASARRQLGAA